MKMKHDIKSIAIALIVIGFLFIIKLQFPIYKVESNAVMNSLPKGKVVLLNKWSGINAGDIVVFNSNDNLYLSRILATSGTKIKCINNKFYSDDILINDTTALFEYKVYCEPTINDSLIDGFMELYPNREYLTLLSREYADSLRIKNGVIKVEEVVHSENYISSVFKDYSERYWSKSNFGPIEIPSNTFWLMNDDRSNVLDSRSFNTINKEDIVGKVVYVF